MAIIRIDVDQCSTGIYLRWWFNGYHYFNFKNYVEINMTSKSEDVFTHDYFSRISQSQYPTKVSAGYSYNVIQEGISELDSEGFRSLLFAELVEQYDNEEWNEVEISRGSFDFIQAGSPAYNLEFTISRKEMSGYSTSTISSVKLYIGDTLCDLEDDEVVPINKQTNDIAEMQDRQSDFTRSFSIKRTNAMRALFEMAGEPGVEPTFPYQKQNCKLIVDGVEVIINGELVLESVEKYYYIVSVYSGNLNFFKAIEGLTLNDLTLAGTAHTWNKATQVAENDGGEDYSYLLCLPNDDAGVSYDVTNTKVHLYGGWLWPMVKVWIIFDEIFSNAGFTPKGEFRLLNEYYNLYMPIANLEIAEDEKNKYLYSAFNTAYIPEFSALVKFSPTQTPGFGVPVIALGDSSWRNFHAYHTRFTAKYKFRFILNSRVESVQAVMVYLYKNDLTPTEFVKNTDLSTETSYVWDLTVDLDSGDDYTFYANFGVSSSNENYSYLIYVLEITGAIAGYSTVFTSLAQHLPSMLQTDFIKMICNMFALVPETNPEDREVLFWNHKVLYDRYYIELQLTSPIGFIKVDCSPRDWSAYLHEEFGTTEFKFGNYAQRNNLKYKDSEDVLTDTGKGSFLIEDETLQSETDVVNLPVSTCDEYELITGLRVSRIAMNKYDSGSDTYKAEKSINPRVVMRVPSGGDITMVIFDGYTLTVPSGSSSSTSSSCFVAQSVPVAFSSLIGNYTGISRLLTKTTMKKLKFNLPAAEVANLKHYISIYIRQHNAYYYVNKVNNYIPGKLCTVDLIKL